ncbi:MAG: Fic family protein [Candidatus Sumerlaeaceae bacterium]
MDNTDRLNRLTQAKQWLDAYRPLHPAIAEELSQRFGVRLTHHSTAIEGNTLTQSETQIVLEKGITIGGKSLNEHLEVIGHKEALDFVLALSNEATPIGEREIREIHSLVMKGQETSDAGAYRSLDVKAAGTEFMYPSHLHVPGQMRDFVTWLNSEANLHPVLRASHAHLHFVTIHPFRDGNGRVGRLLMNLLLLRAGYPIAVIPVQQRAEYIDALVNAQQGSRPDAIYCIVADCVEASLRETLTLCVNSGYASKIGVPIPELQEWLRAC